MFKFIGHINLIFIYLFNLQDELLWGAAWLFRATNDVTYYNMLKSVGDDGGTDLFSWDNKFAGAHVLLARVHTYIPIYI